MLTEPSVASVAYTCEDTIELAAKLASAVSGSVPGNTVRKPCPGPVLNGCELGSNGIVLSTATESTAALAPVGMTEVGPAVGRFRVARAANVLPPRRESKRRETPIGVKNCPVGVVLAPVK